MLRRDKSSWIRHRKMSFRHCHCLAKSPQRLHCSSDIRRIGADEGKSTGGENTTLQIAGAQY